MKKPSLFRITMAVIMIAVLLIPMLPAQTGAAATTNPKAEMRAAWLTTVWNRDMPGKMNESAYTSWARSTLDDLKERKFNAVIFQVKPMNDALYPSKLAPWSSFISGKQGTNPGYDPLQIMLDEAHKRGIELHAWINPYRVATSDSYYNSLSADNVAKKNPSWVVKTGSQYYLNPGLPEVQNYLIDTVKELVKNYDIDAVHMDDYFYPGKSFTDQDTFKKYGAGFKSIEDWRRNNVNVLVKNLYASIKSLKPHVQFGISPRGIWRNKSSDSTGSDTNGSTNYDDIFADTRQWIKDGSIDYITPQIYWSRNFKIANYSTLLNWWNKEVQTYAKAHPVNLYIGVADYKVGNQAEYKDDTTFNNQMELPGQILDNRKQANVQGQMHFSYSDVKKNLLGYSNVLKQQVYTTNALTPATSWKNATAPATPSTVQATVENSGIKLTIKDQNKTQARKYVIYRFDGSQAGSYQDASKIVDVVYNTNGTTVYNDTIANPDKTYTYGITAVSATGVESKSATIAQVGEYEELEYIFKDINSSHRAFKEIAYLKEGAIVSGDVNGKYQPSQNVTRAEAAAMIGRALNLDGTKKNTSFKDVSSSNFASGYIQSAVEQGVLSGYSDGTFRPYAQITRGEMAVMISKAFDYEFGGSLSGAAKALMSRGIAQGVTDGSFGANLSIIRADYAVFLARAIDYNLRVNNPSVAFDENKVVRVESSVLRKGPSTKYTQVGTVAKNEQVSVAYEVGSWSLVKSSQNMIGFVPTADLK